MKTYSALLYAAAVCAVTAATAHAIEVRPTYGTKKPNEDSWSRGVTKREYGLKTQTAQDKPGLYIGADLSYMVADGAQDYPERFGNGSVFLGYRYNRFFAMELSYARTLEGETKREVLPGVTGTTNATLQQLSVDAIGMMPLSEKWTGLVGAGYGLITEEFSSSLTGLGTVQEETEDGSAIRLMGGAEYSLTPNAAIRGTVRYSMPGDQVNDRIDKIWTYNLGMKYQF